jgi:hypothetical protein
MPKRKIKSKYVQDHILIWQWFYTGEITGSELEYLGSIIDRKYQMDLPLLRKGRK